MTTTRHNLVTTRGAAAEIMDACEKLFKIIQDMHGAVQVLKHELERAEPCGEMEDGLREVLCLRPGVERIQHFAVAAEILRDRCDRLIAGNRKAPAMAEEAVA